MLQKNEQNPGAPLSPSQPSVVPVYPSLAEALARWRRADEAFASARSPGERGDAMIEQLRARRLVHRLSEAELLIDQRLRALLVEEGVWSAREALARLEAVDFSARALALRALAPVLPADSIPQAIELATRPGFGDDTRWEIDDELVQALTERAGEHNRAPAAEDATIEPEEEGEASAVTLRSILLSARATGQERWIEPSFGKVLDYVKHHLQPDHAAELSRDHDDPLFRALRLALLAGSDDLWSRPWFRSVFDAEERRGHLESVVARHEGHELPCFEGLIHIAGRLDPARRGTVLRWAIAEIGRRNGASAAVDLARVAALAEGRQRADLLAALEPQIDQLDVDERLTAVAALLPSAPLSEAIALARRGLSWIAGGETRLPDARAFLAAIPAPAWAELTRADWEPSLKAGGSSGGWSDVLRWRSYDASFAALPDLPEEARRLVEEHGLPALLAEDAGKRLRVGAAIIHALSPSAQRVLVTSLLSLDASAGRETRSAVGPIVRRLADDDLDRLDRALEELGPPASRATEGIAEAWAARGRLDRAAPLVARIADDDRRAETTIVVAIAAADTGALPVMLDPVCASRALQRTASTGVGWASEERYTHLVEAMAARLDEDADAADRLDAWAALWPALSEPARAALAPRIEEAVDAVLAADDQRDDVLCAIAPALPDELLDHIWRARASAAAHRHALSLHEQRFGEFMIPDHPGYPCVLRFVQVLGGDDALIKLARDLAGRDPEEP